MDPGRLDGRRGSGIENDRSGSPVLLTARRLGWALSLVLAAHGAEAAGQCADAVLLASDAGEDAKFGSHVATDGLRVVATSPSRRLVYVFEQVAGAWTETARLDVVRVVRSVAIEGDVLLVGIDTVGSVGDVLLFEHDGAGWTGPASLTSSATLGAANYGWDVALDGDRILVGAPSQGPGFVAEFERTAGAWSETGTFAPDLPATADGFGHRVALHGDRAAVAARGTGDDEGRVYLFERGPSGWSQVQLLLATDGGGLPALEDQFGLGLALQGDLVAVGARRDGQAGSEAGAVYVYERGASSWDWSATLFASDADASDHFGQAVALQGARVLVGAPDATTPGVAPLGGALYLFERQGAAWPEIARYAGPQTNPLDDFGASAAMGGGLAAAGAPLADLAGPDNSGSVWLLDVQDLAFQAALSNGIPNLPFGAPRLLASGSICAGEPLAVTMTGADPVSGVTVVLIVGLGTSYAPLAGGTLVPSPDVLLASLTPPNFTGSLNWFGTVPFTAPDDLDIFLQAWVADAGGPQGWVATNGLQLHLP